jgi:integrase
VAGKRTTKGLGTVYQESDGRRSTSYVAARYVTLANGVRKRLKARGRTQEEAIQKLNMKARAAATQTPTGHVRVEDYLDVWLSHKRAYVRASTMRAYEQDVRLHLLPALGRKRVDRLEPRDVQAMLDALVARGARSMADRVRRTLKTSLNAAVKWGYVTHNVMDRIDPIQKTAPRRGVYTLEQIQAFLRHSEPSKYHALFRLAFATGMRKGELLALQWQDVTRSGVHVRRTVSANAGGDGTTPPKTASGYRFIPVESDTMNLVISGRTRFAQDGDWVFTTRNGKRVSARNVSHAMRTIQRRYGLPEIRFHDFRTTYATLLAEAGHHPRVIQDLLGHATPNLAMLVYQEATDRAKEGAYNDLNIGGSSGALSSVGDRHASRGSKEKERVVDDL